MDLLKKHGLKNTRNRELIIKILDDKAPLSAEQIEKKLEKENIKLSSIYRNLALLEENGILIKSIGLDGISYFQINSENHKHQLTCTKCGKTVIIQECPLYDIEEKLEKETGFKILSHSFEFSGLCKDCQIQS